MSPLFSRGGCATALALIFSLSAAHHAHAQQFIVAENGTQLVAAADEQTIVLDTIVVKAASQELKQALGVSTITSDDIVVRAPANDLSEVIRRMPGVNLTGNSSTGTRGNNRQIDIRGMGPENTLILIDGKPVLSRNSVRYGRSGERDTRGDSNWVPAEAVERIEVIRGPAAARYGSGASGGVVNIITKQPTDATYSFASYASIPHHSEEGGSRRANLLAAGPINEFLSYRISAGMSQTDADDPAINDGATDSTQSPAGREGVVNRDVRGLLSWQINADHRVDLEASYSRQTNIYTGDTLYGAAPSASADLIEGLASRGAETNRMSRGTLSATHHGTYDFGDSLSYIQWENTVNRRLNEALAGGPEGTINTPDGFRSIYLDNITAKSEFNIPMAFIWDQTVTIGAEYRGEFMYDNTSIAQVGLPGVDLGTPLDPSQRDPESSAQLFGLYLEDNIAVTDRLMVTPGLRGDYHDKFGLNFSPSLNASYAVTDEITIQGGIARAFKSPNLYQLNPNYVYYTRGNGCPAAFPALGGMGCYVVGNPDLEPEISINKEIGISYTNAEGWNATMTYYHNDYDNRIAAANVPIRDADPVTGRGRLFQWENSGPATISGLEGSLAVPLLDNLTWTTNGTKILTSEDKATGQPLSLIPDYTINTALRWEALENLGLTLSATHYGAIKARTANFDGTPITDPEALEGRKSYTLFNIGADYEINDNLKVTGGVNNVLDERLFRTGNGANTYNEAGRSYYVSLTGTF